MPGEQFWYKLCQHFWEKKPSFLNYGPTFGASSASVAGSWVSPDGACGHNACLENQKLPCKSNS